MARVSPLAANVLNSFHELRQQQDVLRSLIVEAYTITDRHECKISLVLGKRSFPTQVHKVLVTLEKALGHQIFLLSQQTGLTHALVFNKGIVDSLELLLEHWHTYNYPPEDCIIHDLQFRNDRILDQGHPIRVDRFLERMLAFQYGSLQDFWEPVEVDTRSP